MKHLNDTFRLRTQIICEVWQNYNTHELAKSLCRLLI